MYPGFLCHFDNVPPALFSFHLSYNDNRKLGSTAFKGVFLQIQQTL